MSNLFKGQTQTRIYTRSGNGNGDERGGRNDKSSEDGDGDRIGDGDGIGGGEGNENL